jgi:N-acetyl-anhydromuramyl-L-alanine amidase AmpD
MLTIHNVEVLDKKKLNIYRRKTNKKQILLFDTQRRIDDYINKIKNRRNGKYDDIPHFVVSKQGSIFQLFDTEHSSNTFNDPNIDKRQIKIAIENLGWLNKNTITGFLYNWIGDPYRSQPHVRTWRNHYFWDKYSEEQLNSLKKLCDYLCDKHNIVNRSITSQGYFKNAPNFPGIVCKSNFSDIYTDINPSFNFNIFTENE